MKPRIIELSERQLDILKAQLFHDMGRDKHFTLTLKEKAEQLHISASRLYHIKDKFPHMRVEGTRRLLFKP